MNNLSNERLKAIADLGSPKCMALPPSHDQCAAMARELLAYREAQGKPIAWISIRNTDGCIELDEPEAKATNPKFWTDAMPVYLTPQPPAVPQALLRELVDVVWQDAKESTEVPATSHADKLIFQVFGNYEQVNSPVIPDGWTDNDPANSALIMLDRFDTLDSADDARIEEIKRIIRHLAAAPKPGGNNA